MKTRIADNGALIAGLAAVVLVFWNTDGLAPWWWWAGGIAIALTMVAKRVLSALRTRQVR